MPDTPPSRSDAHTSEDTAERVLVSGTGIDGLVAGLTLHDAGHDVTIVDAAHARQHVNVGAVISDTVVTEFIEQHLRDRSVDAEPSPGYQTPVDEYRYLDSEGAIETSFDVDLDLTATDTLTERLQGVLPAATFTEEDGVLSDAEGHAHPHDIHLAADGWLSETRQRLLPTAMPEYAGYVAWTGTIPESSVPGDLTRQFENALSISRGSRDLLVAMVLPGSDGGTTDGDRRLSWVWYSPIAPRDLGSVLTAADGTNHDQAVPPGDLQDQFVEILRTRAGEHAPPLTRLVRATPDPGVEPVVDLSSPQAVVDRTAFVGEAAFATRQHAAPRVAKSIQDVASLVTALERYEDVDAALADWAYTQSIHGRQLVEQGRQTDLEELVGRV